MNIPVEVWPILAVALLLLLCWWEDIQRRRNQRNWDAITAERNARAASYPAGNVTVVFDQDRRAV